MQYLNEICSKHNIKLNASKPLAGGDINEVYKICTDKEGLVIKINDARRFPGMFDREAKSLSMLLETKSFKIPKVLEYGELKGKMYLIMEYVHSASNTNFSESFARALAILHHNQSPHFGLEFNNYIGRLPQQNLPNADHAFEFYINLRLEPQFKMARDRGFKFDNTSQFYKILETLIPDEKPSLIHGDLWSGNYLVTKNGEACIFDPAIAYAPREMDIAMMKLFGGFPQNIFKIYNEIFPMESDWESRIEIWQLYYILVHVNLFGSSYYRQAKGIVDKFVA